METFESPVGAYTSRDAGSKINRINSQKSLNTVGSFSNLPCYVNIEKISNTPLEI